jgi:hypothetical protein
MEQEEQEGDIDFYLVVESHEIDESGYPFRDEKPMVSGNDRGRAELRLETVKLRRGEHYTAEYTFYSANCSYWVYDPFFYPRIYLPGQLAIYDVDRNYVGEMRYRNFPGTRPSANDFVYLLAGSHIGTKIGFVAGNLSDPEFCHLNNHLPAGKYYIQLILYRAFLTSPEYLKDERIDFYKKFGRSVLCRSNAVEIELID